MMTPRVRIRCGAALLPLLGFVLFHAFALGADQPVATPTPPQAAVAAEDFRLCWVLFGQATPERRTAALKHLHERYPDFAADVLGAIAKANPNFYADLDAQMQKMLGDQYPQVAAFIEDKITEIIDKKYPQVHGAVFGLILDKYPTLPADVQALPDGPDRAKQVSDLISKKYPQLPADIVLMVREKFPQVLTELQTALIAAFPKWLFDVAAVVGQKSPKVLDDVLAMMNKKAPGLLEELVNLLTGPPAETATPPAGGK